jgi:hypothetical protein
LTTGVKDSGRKFTTVGKLTTGDDDGCGKLTTNVDDVMQNWPTVLITLVEN